MRAPATAQRRRLPAFATAVMLTVILLLATGCGSETADSGEPASETDTSVPSPAPDAAVAAPAGSGEPPAGETPGPAPPAVVDDVASPPAVPALPDASPPPIPADSPPPRQVDTSGMRTFPSSAVWEALRHCESLGDYGFVHPSGQHFGAYQFTVPTWDRLAGQRYTELLGVVPSEAAPEDQDRMAYYLWIESGSAPWPACRHVFTGDQPPDDAATPVTGPSPQPVPPAADGGEQGSATPVSPPADPTSTSPATDPSATAATDPDGTPEGADVSEPAPGGDSNAPADGSPDAARPEDLPEPEIDPSAQPAIPPDVEAFPTPAQWAALRHCESSGNYRAVSRNGLYFGAYQFWPDTWDSVARRNYPRLVGVLPSVATPQDQTRMAYRLYEERGAQPWPVCGRYLVDGR